jgi:hypothetical protein
VTRWGVRTAERAEAERIRKAGQRRAKDPRRCSACGRKLRRKFVPGGHGGNLGSQARHSRTDWLGHARQPLCPRYGQPPDEPVPEPREGPLAPSRDQPGTSTHPARFAPHAGRTRVALLVTALVLMLVPAAHATSYPSVREARARMARVPLPPRMPTRHVGEQCPGLGNDGSGCYDETTNTLWIIDSDRFGILHEIGHAYDRQTMDAHERQRFATLIGMPRSRWFDNRVDPAGNYVTGDGSVGEFFADEYATCRMQLLPMIGSTWTTSYGYWPSVPRQLRICALIARAARSPGTPVAADGSR